MPAKQFLHGNEATAAKPFTFSGVKYVKGERFPYRDLRVIEFELVGLWRADLIEFANKPYGHVDEDELERLTAPRPAAVAKRR